MKPLRFLQLSLILLGVMLLLYTRPTTHTATLAFLGDIMLGRGVSSVHHSGSWDTAFADLIPHLKSADLALANLESPLSVSPPAISQQEQISSYNLCAGSEVTPAVTTAGLDLLSLANNHSLDCGPEGVDETKKILLTAGITPIGPNPAPVQLTINGLRLAFLSFDDVTAPLDSIAVSGAVVQARSFNDIVIISIHWGSEYHPGPDQHQRDLAQVVADAGAALIWGHHPHVLQPINWIQGEGQPYPTLVAYSLGNALFDQPTPPDVTRSALLLVTVKSNGVQSIQVIPLQIDVRQGRTVLANPETATIVQRRLGID